MFVGRRKKLNATNGDPMEQPKWYGKHRIRCAELATMLFTVTVILLVAYCLFGNQHKTLPAVRAVEVPEVFNASVPTKGRVFISVQAGRSYDRRDPTRFVRDNVLFKSVRASDFPALAVEYLETRPTNEDHAAIFQAMRNVGPNSVVFNFECSAGIEDLQAIYRVIPALVAKGHVIQIADFSLKGFIRHWNTREWGPCPFLEARETHSGRIKLVFDRSHLKLAKHETFLKIDNLFTSDTVYVGCMGGTILYTLNPRATDDSFRVRPYKLSVMSQASTEKSDFIGHVELTFPSGGTIVASMTHWHALERAEVNEERIVNYYKKSGRSDLATAYLVSSSTHRLAMTQDLMDD